MSRPVGRAARDRAAAAPLPAGFAVHTEPRAPCPGVRWVVTDPHGRRHTSDNGAFYDDHDGPGDTAEAAALAWGRIAAARMAKQARTRRSARRGLHAN